MKRALVVIVLSALVFAEFGTVNAQVPENERTALIALYSSTNGNSWTDNNGWEEAQRDTECTWYGVTCEGGSVVEIDLRSNNLEGTIPSELGQLTFLEKLYLNDNQLTGAIPPELGDLNNLLYIALSTNQLDGAIPLQLRQLTVLERLYLYDNQLTGTIPDWLGDLTSLVRLELGSNQLTGEIPVELGDLTNLTHLTLYRNQLDGDIPVELGNLGSLIHLSLYDNQLTGTIPVELGNLTNLTYLALSTNQLTGAIPFELSNLRVIERLYLYNNQLTGTIPDWLGDLTSLVRLELGSNQLTGEIPVELGNLINLTHLTLHRNQLDGDIPPELRGLTKLEQLNLYGNQLNGPVPAEITSLNSLKNDCDFRYNALYTSEDAVRIFLNNKQRDGDWESTQTIAPTNLVAGEITGDSVPLTWTAIAYTDDTGGYEIYYADTPGGPFMLFETTADKTVDNATVTGLTPGTYYFRLRTVTDSHARNQNIVYSEYSEMVIGGEPSIEETIDFFDQGVEDGTITGSSGLFWGQIQLNIMRRHLARARDLIERGNIGAACWRLRRAYLSCDGEGYDWVKGEDVEELAQSIYDLAVSLDCWWTTT